MTLYKVLGTDPDTGSELLEVVPGYGNMSQPVADCLFDARQTHETVNQGLSSYEIYNFAATVPTFTDSEGVERVPFAEPGQLYKAVFRFTATDPATLQITDAEFYGRAATSPAS